MGRWKDKLGSQKGFTLLEILLMVAVLGLLAAVVIPNVTAFTRTGNLAGANTEAQNVKTAEVAYRIDQGVWPSQTSDPAFQKYYTGSLKAMYIFDTTGSGVGIGLIESAQAVAGGWPDNIQFYSDTQKWEQKR